MPSNRSLDAVVVATRDQVSSALGDEAAILHTAQGAYYGLNPVGTHIWSLVQQPRTVRELRDSVVREYEVDPAQCEADLFKLLGELKSAGLIELRDAPGT